MIPVGTRFERTFTVTPEIHGGFIALFGDSNPLHTDTDFALSKGFTGKVMHGNILNGFLSYFIGECLPMKNVIIHGQEIKYSKPVYLNDALVLKAKVDEVFESVSTMVFSFYFENAKNVKVAKGKVQIGVI